MTGAGVSVAQAWLELREAADARARSAALAERVAAAPPDGSVRVVHDLACGTGAMARWLAPRLRGPQRWLLYDWDAGLLRAAAAGGPLRSADGCEVAVRPTEADIRELGPARLADASLITASALLDLMTAEELDRMLTVCAAARRPMLFTLTVSGRVVLDPADPLDEPAAAAFNAHQRRAAPGGRLLGPDAAGAAADWLRGHGFEVLTEPSPWLLGRDDAGLIREWMGGWLDAACEQDGRLESRRAGYERRRLDELAAGALQVTVDHIDLLAVPL